MGKREREGQRECIDWSLVKLPFILTLLDTLQVSCSGKYHCVSGLYWSSIYVFVHIWSSFFYRAVWHRHFDLGFLSSSSHRHTFFRLSSLWWENKNCNTLYSPLPFRTMTMGTFDFLFKCTPWKVWSPPLDLENTGGKKPHCAMD